MKLRLAAGTLRLRLARADLDRLAATGAVTEVVHVAPGAALAYSLRADDRDALGVDVAGAALTVLVPRAWVGPWAETDAVGFSATVAAGDGRTLALLVEKDVDCLHRADGADTFSRPTDDADAG